MEYGLKSTWWLDGKYLQVVPGLEYDHRVDKAVPANCDRSPTEKEALAPIYLLELTDRALLPRKDWNNLSEYRLIESRRGTFLYSSVQNPDLTIAVDMASGKIEHIRI